MSPHLDAVRVERVWVAGGVVRIAACTRELTAACPDCGRGSARVHSRYGRTLVDVAVGGRPVLIGQSENCLGMPLAFSTLAFVEAARVVTAADADERGGVEDALQAAVVAPGPLQVAAAGCR